MKRPLTTMSAQHHPSPSNHSANTEPIKTSETKNKSQKNKQKAKLIKIYPFAVSISWPKQKTTAKTQSSRKNQIAAALPSMIEKVKK